MQIKTINDYNLWENFISKYSPQSFFQSWNWGEVVKKRYPLKTDMIWRLGIYDRNDLLGIAQIVKITAKRGIFLHIRHGPIFKSLQENLFSFFLLELKKIAKQHQACFIRISPLIENTSKNFSFFKKYGFGSAPIHSLDAEYCWVVDLTQSQDDLLKNMRKTTRYLIKQAIKLGVVVKKSESIEDINNFLELYHQTSKRHHFIEHEGIREEFEVLAKNKQVLIFNGYLNHHLISSALIIFYNHQAIYHHSASIEQKIPVNYLLQWEIMMEAKKRGARIYNMWGIAPLDSINHPWKGITLFKTGFGGRIAEYLHAHDLALSPKYLLTFILDNYRKIRRGY